MPLSWALGRWGFFYFYQLYHSTPFCPGSSLHLRCWHLDCRWSLAGRVEFFGAYLAAFDLAAFVTGRQQAAGARTSALLGFMGMEQSTLTRQIWKLQSAHQTGVPTVENSLQNSAV